MPQHILDLVDKKFNKLTVIQRVENNKHNKTCWLCRCDCGNEVVVIGSRLVSGLTKSCGCIKRNYNKYDLTGEYGIGWTNNTNHEFYFDLEDYDIIKDYSWRENNGYVESHKSKVISLHRLVMNAKADEFIDHIYHNTYDNRKSQLRITDNLHNSYNHKIHKNNSCGCSGITLNKISNKWRVRISVNGKRIEIGSFDDIKDAINARQEAEIFYYKDYRYKGE